jgi:putative transposase
VRNRQRRLTEVDQIVLSLSALGLMTGEISAHFAEMYGPSASKDTVSAITDQMIDEMTVSCRPLLQGRQPNRSAKTMSAGLRAGSLEPPTT